MEVVDHDIRETRTVEAALAEGPRLRKLALLLLDYIDLLGAELDDRPDCPSPWMEIFPLRGRCELRAAIENHETQGSEDRNDVAASGQEGRGLDALVDQPQRMRLRRGPQCGLLIG